MVLLKEKNQPIEFFIDNYLNNLKTADYKEKKYLSETEIFLNLCSEVQVYFEEDWKKAEGQELKILERQTKALIGIPDHVNYFKDSISKYLKDNAKYGLSYPK